MHEELDPALTRLFANTREPAADEAFTAMLLLKIEQARRARLWRQIVTLAGAVTLLALNLRWVLESTGAVVRLAGDLAPLSTHLLITPWGWAVSLCIGSWLLLRFGPLRR